MSILKGKHCTSKPPPPHTHTHYPCTVGGRPTFDTNMLVTMVLIYWRYISISKVLRSGIVYWSIVLCSFIYEMSDGGFFLAGRILWKVRRFIPRQRLP